MFDDGKPCHSANTTPIAVMDISSGQRCAAVTHVVFIARTRLASTVMRGRLTVSVLMQTRALHGARASLCEAPCNTTQLQAHFHARGKPTTCILIKYPESSVQDLCRAHGALVVLDSVDNHRLFAASTVATRGYKDLDAMLVQTWQHALWLQAQGVRSVVLPHSHGNLNGWNEGKSIGVREHIRGVGFLIGDRRNLPDRFAMELLTTACCAANATLWLISSAPGWPTAFEQQSCPNATRMIRLRRSWAYGNRPPRGACQGVVASVGMGSCSAAPTGQPVLDHRQRSGAIASSTLSQVAAAAAGSSATSWAAVPGQRRLIDATGQRPLYQVPRLHELIDVGLLWSPGGQVGNAMAVANRPPTRLHWWWSEGMPTIGEPMVAYAEAAWRVGYPRALLNLSKPYDIQQALQCAVRTRITRQCLRSRAQLAAQLTSPQHSAMQLLVSLCAVAREAHARCPHRHRTRVFS